MNSYRVDVQTPMGPRQHIVKAESEGEARDKIKKRVYPKLRVDIEGIYSRDTIRREPQRIDHIEELSDVLHRHPGVSASQISENYIASTRKTVTKHLEAMCALGLVNYRTQECKGREVKYWTLAGQDAA